ncbi:MAG: Gfo/Idh/MocA family protein [Bryobacteraceae bacterium]
MTTSRRHFIAGSAAAPAILHGSPSSTAANDKPAFGVIAAGGRARYLARYFAKLGAECAAVCDVREDCLQEALKDFPQAKTSYHHEGLLSQRGIDFTVCAGPDHWHFQHLVDSLNAGKDVYTEKPLSKTLQ